MTKPLGGVGHVRIVPGGRAYPNSYVEPGKTIRVALCGKCLDSGHEMTDDGSRGEVCDCTFGEALSDAALAHRLLRIEGS